MIKEFNEITIEWLEACLRTKIDINSGFIKNFKIVSTSSTHLAQIASVRLEYKNTSKFLPILLFLKISKNSVKNDFLTEIATLETKFYNKLSILIDESTIVKCYRAEFDENSGLFNIVLDNISETHDNQTEYPIPPTYSSCQQAVECLSKIHAGCWDKLDINEFNDFTSSFDFYNDYLKKLDPVLIKFIDFIGDRLSNNKIKLFNRLVSNYNAVIQRYSTKKNITLRHGDTHFWNFLFPKPGTGSNVKLIDWQRCDNGLGAMDLAYMLALHWFPERRKNYELNLLKHYHKNLVANGVRNYTVDDLIYDYRVSIIEYLSFPAWQYHVNTPAIIWWPQLECILNAFEEWKCEELLY